MPRNPFAPEYEEVRKILVEIRRKSGMTQAELAKKIGRAQPFVSKYESGERRVDVVDFVRISLALKADPARLIRKLSQQISNKRQ